MSERIPYLPRTEALFTEFIMCPPTPRQIMEKFNELERENAELKKLVEQMADTAIFARRIAYPQRGTADECCDVQDFADQIQALYDLQKLGGIIDAALDAAKGGNP